MTTTTASDFQKKVGEYSDLARREPVVVTKHGRPSLVLLAAEDYERLKQIEGRATRSVKMHDLPSETFDAIEAADLSHLPVD